MSEYILYLSFWVWVASLNMIFFRSILLSANFKMSFFSHCVVFRCINIPHFIYLSLVGGHLGCFQVLVITNNAIMDIAEHMSLWYDWYDLYPKAVLLGLELGCFSNFLRNSHTDFQSSCTSLHSYQQWRSAPFISHPFQHKFS